MSPLLFRPQSRQDLELGPQEIHPVQLIIQAPADGPLLLHQGPVLLDHGGGHQAQVGSLLGPLQLLGQTPDGLHVSQPSGDLSLSLEVCGLARKLLLLGPGFGELVKFCIISFTIQNYLVGGDRRGFAEHRLVSVLEDGGGGPRQLGQTEGRRGPTATAETGGVL